MEKILLAQIPHATRYGKVPTVEYGVQQAKNVRAFHKTLPGYAVTPLVNLSRLAVSLGIKDIYIKDESKRFGLNAFKGLGGSYAVAREIAKRLFLDPAKLTFAEIVSPAAKDRVGTLTFITATDGNHGRGIAWIASLLGHKALVYMPKGSSLERLHNIQAFGAEAYITDLNYDDAVRFANRTAEESSGIVVQDTSWEGYEEVPRHIMQGYTTMLLETVEQLGDVRPTHVFLQAGVGAMSGAATCFLADYYKEQRPVITIVEPSKADCVYRTAKAGDGKLHKVGGPLDSIMSGLCCGEPCSLGWEKLSAYADNFISMPDEVAALGMRILASPLIGDGAVVSGESGAAGFGLAMAALRDSGLAWLKEKLGLNKDSVILCISTEGDTDVANYRRIVWEGAWPWVNFGK